MLAMQNILPARKGESGKLKQSLNINNGWLGKCLMCFFV